MQLSYARHEGEGQMN